MIRGEQGGAGARRTAAFDAQTEHRAQDPADAVHEATLESRGARQQRDADGEREHRGERRGHAPEHPQGGRGQREQQVHRARGTAQVRGTGKGVCVRHRMRLRGLPMGWAGSQVPLTAA